MNAELPFSSLAPEFRALIAIVGQEALGNPDGPALHRALAEIRDWNLLLAGAERHRVVAPVYRALAALPAGQVPDTVLQTLRDRTRNQAAKCLAQLSELRRLLHLFHQASIPVLVVKGLALSHRLYGQIFHRGVGDIDLLIAPEGFASAHAMLTDAGYVLAETGDTQPPPAALLPHFREVTYRHAAGHVVELHLCLEETLPLPDFSFQQLWSQRVMQDVGGLSVPVPADAALLPYLIAHGARHCWDRLSWLADIAVLTRSGIALPDDRFASLGIGRPAAHALDLIDLWYRRLPAARTPIFRQRWFQQAFFSGRRWLDRPRRGTPAWVGLELRRRRWLLYLDGGWRSLPRAWARAWNVPADYGVLRLPSALAFLYPVLRPIGWVIRNFIRRGP